MKRLPAILMLLVLACPLARSGEGEASAGARAAGALERRLAILLREGTAFDLRRRYEVLLADASAAAERHADDPGAARVYLVIARCCEALGKHPEKDAAFGQYIETLAGLSKAEAAKELRREVEALVARRELFVAIKLLRLMLSKFPDGDEAAYALYRLGTCHLWMDRHEEAATALAEVIERWPKSEVAVQARLRLARAHLVEGDHSETIGLLEGGLALHPDTPHRPALLFDLAMARYLSDDHYGALATFQRLLREAPESPYAPLAEACLAKLRTEVIQRISD